MPEQFAQEFIAEATPPVSPPGYAPNGESGYLEVVRKHESLPPGGRQLGFELLNVQLGMFEDSWLCNGLEKHCVGTLQIRPSSNGLLGSLEDALRCRTEIEREETAAEPRPWFPVLLTEY